MSRPINTASNSGRTLDRYRERCARKYRLAKQLAAAYFRNHRFEESLLLAQASATFARSHHFGVWSDDELEELLSSIGTSIFRTPADGQCSGGCGTRRILYITTMLDAVGGHGEVLRLWLKLFSSEQNVEQYLMTTMRATQAFLTKIEGSA